MIGRPRRSVAALLVAVGATSLAQAVPAAAASACGLPDRFRLRIWRGFDPKRSGEVQLVARGQNLVGAGFPHAGPQDHLQEVPMFLYGPGIVAPGTVVDRPVSSADIAPTQARLVGTEPGDVDGAPLAEALLPGAAPPALVVTVVWDAAGIGVLNEYPESWPELRALRDGGTWYRNATVGSSPSTSAAIHGTIGTGTFPKRHGLAGTKVRVGGRLIEPWRRGPRLLREPAFGDQYDAAAGNAPIVAAVGSAAIQLALIGHGG
ncbi:MAG TPA: alkaline phosphatase family protein, partial [Actinomycetota bacterium]|nr:alkaline phosphatase family protein [Actinomycetota bacterium]